MVRYQWIILLLLISLPLSAGRLERVDMPTRSALNKRPLLIYLPDAYDRDTTTIYPVLYLLHGINGDEKSWTQKGQLVQVVDSLIENGLIRPCIVVMPNTNAGRYIWEKEDHSGLRNVLGYRRIRNGNFAQYFHEIMRYTDSHYRISHVPEDCLIAGLSNGACQAADVVMIWPERFSHVGLFSPVLGMDQVPLSHEALAYDLSVPDASLVYHLYIGRADFFRPNGMRFARRLHRRQIPCLLTESHGGHNWRNWRTYLSLFLQTSLPGQKFDR